MSSPYRVYPGFNGSDMLIRICLIVLGGILLWALVSASPWSYGQSVPPALQQAAIKLEQGKDQEAGQLIQRALAEEPESATLYQTVLGVYARYERWQPAIEIGEQALLKAQNWPKPDRAQIHALLAGAYLEAQPTATDWQSQAQQHARAAYELTPNDPEMLNAYGYTLAELGRDLSTADSLLQQALLAMEKLDTSPEADLRQAMVLDSLGWLRYRQGKDVEAVSLLEQAVRRMPDGTSGSTQREIYFHLGAACRRVGRYEDARRYLQVALFYAPNNTRICKEWNALPPLSAPSSTRPRPETDALPF